MIRSVPGAVATGLWAWHTRPYRELRAGRIHHPNSDRSNTRLVTPYAIRARLPAFRANIVHGFRGHPAPASFEAPSWRLSPTQPSAALAKHEQTGALSTLKLRLARRREIVRAAAGCTILRSLRFPASAARAACAPFLHHRRTKLSRPIVSRHSRLI